MDVTATLDPEIAALLAASPLGALDLGSLTPEMLTTMQDATRNMEPPQLPPTTTTSRTVVVGESDGAFDLSARVYSPPTVRTDRGCLYWIHGGGFIMGSGLTQDPRLDRWVEELDCVAVSIDYRLAPGHPYPKPLDDCHLGLQWTVSHADELGIDPTRIVLAGASAGAGLAAALALLARDRGEIAVAHQLLVYPMLDDRMITPSSQIEGAPIWSREANVLGWRSYLGHEPGVNGVDAYAAPARATDLANLPPTWIGVGTLDIFRDEDIDYASRLLASGVPTELHVYAGAPHGFEMLAASSGVARRFQLDMDDALRRAFG
ncbi:MAG: alpha/beta hydrolase [Acidimicrobiia bacterium]